MTLYTIREVAEMLKVHEGTVRRWIREQKLTSFKFSNSGSVRVTQDSLNNFLSNSQNKVI